MEQKHKKLGIMFSLLKNEATAPMTGIIFPKKNFFIPSYTGDLSNEGLSPPLLDYTLYILYV